MNLDILANVAYLNNSKILAGVSMILMNLGSRYVMSDLGIVHNRILSSEIVKKIIVFAMFFVATRDILTAFMLTISYIFIVDGVLHEKRRFCIVPEKYRQTSQTENEQKLTIQDYIKAKTVIELYERQQVSEKQTGEKKDIEQKYKELKPLNAFDIYKQNLTLLNSLTK